MEEILRLFPNPFRQAIELKIANRWNDLQEIRFRINQPIEFIFNQETEWLEQLIPNEQIGSYVVNQLSEFSLYRLETELREGFITIEGGHRIGLAGKVNTEKGFVKALQHITFMNIRIAKEKIGVATSLIPYLYSDIYKNTLFVGAPQTGKTTLIRDVTRMISSGWKNTPPRKVAVIDERSEIGASIKGVPQHNLGRRTDLLDACPKAEGMMMMIRSMSPDVLVVDEIGGTEDVRALLEAIHAGVVIICSVHGNSLADLKKRPSLQSLLKNRIFQRIIILSEQAPPGTIKYIYDENEQNILQKSRCSRNEVDWSTSVHHNHYMGRV